MAIPLAPLGGLGDPTQTAAAPQNYMTPEAIKAQRDYANALMLGDQGKSGRQFPVVQSWTQGVSNMVNAIMGGMASRDANAKEQGAINGTIPPNPAAAKPSFSEGPSSEGRNTASGDDTSPEAKAIASVESKGSGDYSAVGPVTKRGDRAYGRYQVMGENVPAWTKEVLGKSMSPEEFLNNPQAQDAVFKTKFAQGGNNDADRASVWFTGKPYAQGKDRSDGYITGAQYVDRFQKAMPQGGAQTAMALAGPDGGEAPQGVQAITAALRGGAGNPQVAANAGRSAPPSNMPEPSGTGIYYDPRLIRPPPQYSQEQMRAVMNNPVLTPEAKNQMLQQYRTQGQPITLPYPGGAVIVDPLNPTKQQFIPEGHWSNYTSKLGDMEKSGSQFLVPSPNGTIRQAPVVAPPAIGPRSEAVPPVSPTSAPAGPAGAPGAAPATPGSVVTQNAPQAPATAPIMPQGGGAAPASPAAATAEAAAAGKPVQVASLDPAAGVNGGTPSPAPDAADNPLAKWAAATPPGGVPANVGSPGQSTDAGLHLNEFTPQETEDYARKKAFDTNTEVNMDAQKKGTELAFKKYDTLSTQAQNARTLVPNVELALGMMSDPNFHSGLLSGAKDFWSRFKEAALGDKYANAPNETFDKLMASNVLGTMKTALGGLGQVRLAEIQLLNKANGNRYNTDASNRAVLEISRRGLQKVDQIDGMGQQYVSGDSVVDPKTGVELLPANVDRNGEVQPRRGLDVGFDKLVRKWTNDNPSFTAEEIKNYNTIFDTNRPPEQGTAKTNEKAATDGAPAVGTEKQFKQGVGVWDGKQWVPKKQ